MPEGKTGQKGPLKAAAWIKKAALITLRIYQNYISPLKPAVCRFYPTCSQYCYEAIEKYGVLRGSYLGLKRILRCHPFSPGGYQPLE